MKAKISITALLAIGFIVVTYLVVTNNMDAFDKTISEFFYSIRTPGLNTLIEGITYLGEWEAIVIICILLLVYPGTRFAYGIPVATVALLTSGFKSIVKPLMERVRPDVMYHLIEQGGYSYPSGHAITSIAVYGILIFLVQESFENKKKANLLTVLLAFLAFGVGFSRIYLGVHYPSDVLGGWLAGGAFLSLVLIMREKWLKPLEKESA